MSNFIVSKEELITSFNSSESNGLTTNQVKLNGEKFGINVFSRGERISMLKRILDALREPLIMLLLFAAFLALVINVMEILDGGKGDIIECIGIFIAISLSVAITVLMEDHSAKAFEALNKINDDLQIKGIRNGEILFIPQDKIVSGDILFIERGDKVPADGRILDSSSLYVDESSLTGESLAVEKDSAATFTDPKTPVAERTNMIYSGSFITNGTAKFIVTEVGDKTEFGKIAHELSSVETGNTPLQEKLTKLGKRISLIAVTIAVLVFVLQILRHIANGTASLETISDIFVTSIVLIVASVPEGLPTIVAVSLSLNIIKMSKQNALVKKMVACETIGCTNVICSDKTGTLTENKMTVSNVYAEGSVVLPSEVKAPFLLNNFALNSTADVTFDNDNYTFIGNPTECALLVATHKSNKNYAEIRDENTTLLVFPFTSETKNMTVITKNGNDCTVYTKGSPEKILSMCDISNENKIDIEEKIANFQRLSGRVIAFAHKSIDSDNISEDNRAFIENALNFDGFVVIKDPLRADVHDAVMHCRNAGIELKMLTGDNIVTAHAIANELGIIDKDHIAVEARELEDLSDSELEAKLPYIRVIARSTPTIKMRVVNALKRMGNVVAVTGDGINDAPAIKNSDVGLAMGIAGTEVSKEASDIVLLDDAFSTIVKAVKWGRGIYENFQRFIQFQLTVNLASVTVVLVTTILGFDTPFTALQLLWVNVIMDGPPALTLGIEPIRSHLMRMKPTKRDANIITKTMLINIITNGLLISFVFLAQYFYNFMNIEPAQQSGVLFSLFVVFQLFNAFNCRELDNTSIFTNIISNKPMLAVFAIVFVLQIFIIEFAGTIFNSAAIDLLTWIKIIATSFSIIVFSEIIKLLRKI
ncbi:MAG: calcium-translocating P-type ATPase, PMCA-type [Synergistaceae bacterium]